MATSPAIRKANKRNTYRYIYDHKETSKKEIAYALGQSMPTVKQNLSELEAEGLIHVSGLYESTGGRKAMVLQCTADARVAAGVEILSEHVVVVILDLYGNVLSEAKLEEPYRNETDYFVKIGNFISDHIAACYPENQFLGLAVATQGITSYDHKRMIYGRILDNSNVTAAQLESYIGRPCILVHDSEAAAFAESFHRPNLRDSNYIFLNKNLGSASIINGAVYRGNHGRGQLVEHMKLVRNGRKCYCGQRGCSECYCSANALNRLAGVPIEEFFHMLRQGSPEMISVWDEYLEDLSLLLYNVFMTMDVEIIIGGLLRKYMVEQDLIEIKSRIRRQSDFDISDHSISLEYITDHPAAQGAALFLIRQFLDDFEAD